MKVLHLINTLSAGGAELHLLTLCRHLNQKGVANGCGLFDVSMSKAPFFTSDFENAGIRVI